MSRFLEKDLDMLLEHQADEEPDEYEITAAKHSQNRYTATITIQVLASDIDVIEDYLGDLLIEAVAKAGKKHKQEMTITDYSIDEIEPASLD